MRQLRLSLLCTFMSLVLCACAEHEAAQPDTPPRGDAARGKATLTEFECNVCHVIPGVSGRSGHVGPPLSGYSKYVYVAGKFPKSPEVLARWIRDAPAMAPQTAMPAFKTMSETQAHDIAAYLDSLR